MHFITAAIQSLCWKNDDERCFRECSGVRIAGTISNLRYRYADDTIQIAESEIVKIISFLSRHTFLSGLHLNLSKTKIMTTGPFTMESWRWTERGSRLQTTLYSLTRRLSPTAHVKKKKSEGALL